MKLPALVYSWGSDPESFIARRDTGEIISSLNVIKKDKHDPIDLGDGVKYYCDGVGLEFVLNPTLSVDQIQDRFRVALKKINKSIGKKYRLVPKASHLFTDRELKRDKRALQIGCNPYLSVYEKKQKYPMQWPDNRRVCGLHIHCGRADWETATDHRLMSFQSKEQAVRLTDIFAGCASVIIDKDESAQARRVTYGEAGAFRCTKYGVETRCIGAGLMASPVLTQLIYDLAAHAMTYISDDNPKDILDRVDEKDVQTAINEGNRDLARKVIETAGLPAPLMARVNQEYNIKGSFEEEWGIAV